MKGTYFTGILLALFVSVAFGGDDPKLAACLSRNDVACVKSLGDGVMPGLVRKYETSKNNDEKAVLAWMFYNLGWKSQEAKRALMKDVHTDHQNLRLQAQWALGRVSSDPDVVNVLLKNMQHDNNPLFRDKAACALAYDQIHLTEDQKVRLFEGLIASLRSPNEQVRSIALMALKIHTGQTKNFRPNAPENVRNISVQGWEKWLAEYKANL